MVNTGEFGVNTGIDNTGEMIEEFEIFCQVKLQLADRTVEGHIQHIKEFTSFLPGLFETW